MKKLISKDNEKNTAVKSRIIRIQLINNTFITGEVNLNRNANYEYERLSDLLTNDSEHFLIVFNAIETRKELEQEIKHKVIFVNKKYILMAMPEDNQK